jgi:mRNA interferase RelE/StbE
VTYAVRYHPRVADRDLKKIPTAMRSRIARAIQERLATQPERFGVPLAGTLHGYWKLRIGDYRVVFQVADDEVFVLAILHRREVYGAAPRRLP